MTFTPSNGLANFLDPSIIFPDDEDQLKYIQREAYYNTAGAVNNREIGLYPLQEIVVGNQYYIVGNTLKFRGVFRKTFNIASISTGATSTVAHGINMIAQMVRVEGTCTTDTPDYRSIPHASATLVTDQTQITVTSTNIIIVNGSTAPNLSNVNVVLEYCKTLS